MNPDVRAWCRVGLGALRGGAGPLLRQITCGLAGCGPPARVTNHRRAVHRRAYSRLGEVLPSSCRSRRRAASPRRSDRRSLACRGYRRRSACCGRSRVWRRRRRLRGYLGRRSGGRWQARGQERERVDVAVFVGRPPDAEMHVGNRKLRNPARADSADRLTFGDRIAAPDPVRAEVHKRDGVAVHRLDRHDLAQSRDRPGEGDGPRRRRDDRGPGRSADVDPAMLSGGVGRALVEREERQDRPVDRPAPAERGCGNDQGNYSSQGEA